MKLTILALALSLAPEIAQACVTAHVYLNNCIIGGDTLSAQVFDNGVEVCNGGQTINLASEDSNFCISGCNPGYSFCVTDNAGTAVYDNGNGYRVTLTRTKTQNMDYVCGVAGDDHDINGSEVESCFTDNFSNCNLYTPCDLCDYRASCS